MKKQKKVKNVYLPEEHIPVFLKKPQNLQQSMKLQLENEDND